MKPVSVSDSNFEHEVLQSNGIVLVDFWAPWCGPCKMMEPILDQVSSSFNGKVKIKKLNVDNNPKTAQDFGIRSIPTLIFFKNGAIVDKLIGAVPRKELESRIKKALQLEAALNV